MRRGCRSLPAKLYVTGDSVVSIRSLDIAFHSLDSERYLTSIRGDGVVARSQRNHMVTGDSLSL